MCIASGLDKKTFKIWNVKCGSCLNAFNYNRVRLVTFSPNGMCITSDLDDKTAKVRNINSENCLIMFKSYSSVAPLSCLDHHNALV